MNLDQIRTTIITAIASDEKLVELLVLKGGNALELVHKIGQRASLDLDFSLENDFEDLDDIESRLFRALTDRFDAAGIVVFDEAFGPRPSNRLVGARWGGYNAEFKLIGKDLHARLDGDLNSMRIQAIENGPGQQRKFRIEISAFEFCGGKQAVDVDDFACYVYSLEMIAVEKLRAICQQSPNYPHRKHPAPRARDFYDIFAAVSEGGVKFARPAIHGLVRTIFAAKQVDLTLIGEVHQQREFHRLDWAAVENAVRVKLRQFDYYFEFVLAEIEALKPLWVV